MDPRIDIDDRRIQDALKRLDVASGGNAPRAMAAIGRFMKTSTQLRFRQGKGPDGSTWWPSNRARKEGGQTLRDTNRLFRSITWKSGPAFAETGTNVVYAAAHHFGVRKIVTVRPHRRITKGRNKAGGISVKSVPVKSFARLMFLPRREIFGFSTTDRVEILDILREHLLKTSGN